MQIRIIEIIVIKLTPSNKIKDKSISEIRRDATSPINKTETDKILIKIEAFTWLQPLSISL